MTVASGLTGALAVPPAVLAAQRLVESVTAPLSAKWQAWQSIAGPMHAQAESLRAAGESVAAEMRSLERQARPRRLAGVTPDAVALAGGDMRTVLALARLVGREIADGHGYTASLVSAALRGDADALDEFRGMAESDASTAALARDLLALVDVLARLAADGSTRSRLALRLIEREIRRAVAVVPAAPLDSPPDPWTRDVHTAAVPTNGPSAPAPTCATFGHARALAA